MLGENGLSILYNNRFAMNAIIKKSSIWKILCRHFFQKWVGEDAFVVDVACGHGDFINNIRANKKIGLDLNIDSKKYLSNDVDFHVCNAKSIVQTIGAGVADVLFTSNFLEHLHTKSELEHFLDQVMGVLKQGGQYIILGPNLRYLPGQYWDFYDHHLGLTDRSLCEVLCLKGFSIEVCIDKFLPFTTKSRLPQYAWLVYLYLKLPFVWRFFGKQFFIVARKVD